MKFFLSLTAESRYHCAWKMAYFSIATAPERRNLTGKNRVWDFFPLSNKQHPANRRQPAQPRRKIRPIPTKTVSGIPYWPSRDPIGENGGVNLFGFVGNDGVNYGDGLGLAEWNQDDKKCILQAAFKFKLNWIGKWTDPRKKAFTEALKRQIESAFNSNIFNLKTRVKCCPCSKSGFRVNLRLDIVDKGAADMTVDVLANPRDDYKLHISHMATKKGYTNDVMDGKGGSELDEADPFNEYGRTSQPIAAHEFGHFLGLEHSGQEIVKYGGVPDPYHYKGKDRHGNLVDGNSDLMGVGSGLRSFYFKRWAYNLNAHNKNCDYTF